MSRTLRDASLFADQARGGWKIEELPVMAQGAGRPTVHARGGATSTSMIAIGAPHWSDPSGAGEAVETGNGARPEQLKPEHGSRRAGEGGFGGICFDSSCDTDPLPETITSSRP
jgi:hypothetical protein